MRVKKYFMHVLLLFYLFSSFLNATHIHHDGLISHDKCSVCIVAKNLHSADSIPSFTLDKIYFEYSAMVDFITYIRPSNKLKYIYSQAPPFFS